MRDMILGFLYTIPGILIAITVHSYAKAKMAVKLGDMTPKFQGRVTLNPLAHIDPIGTLLILICRMGWSKGLEINPGAFKKGYKDDVKVQVAGLLAMLIASIVGAFLSGIFMALTFAGIIPGAIGIVLGQIALGIFSVNVSLFVFYLIPLPGLDGFLIFRDLNPKAFYKFADMIMPYQWPIMFGILIIGGYIIRIPVNIVGSAIMHFVTLILGMIF